MFLKSATLPLLSVNLPSSNTWSKILKVSGWAFSISSNKITEYGFLLTASVSCPPSSYPTYPGGAPINLLTECLSWYSLISIRVIEFSSSNKYSARALASSVFPTPVVPKNRKVPIGFVSSCNPALDLLTASDTAWIASSCPIILLCSSSSKYNNFERSLWSIFVTGIPVHFATTSAISSLVTSSFISAESWFSANSFWNFSNFVCSSLIFPYLISATLP